MLTVPGGDATTGDHLDEQTTERVAHQHGLAVEAGDDLRDVVGDVGDRRTGEGLVVAAGGLHRGGVPRPVDGDGRVPLRLEALAPRVPAARQQPESVDEHDGLAARLVGGGDLGRLAGGDGAGHGFLLV
jgi:hypothetical protein